MLDTDEINNSEDIIDLRDVVARVERLRVYEDQTDEEEQAELAALLELLEDCGGGVEDEPTLIRESYFEEYAQQLAEDLGYMPRDLHWPFDCIDWEKAAQALRFDYSAVDFDGVTYLRRAY